MATIRATSGAVTTGTAASDTMYGHEGADTLYGRAGDDTIWGADGADRLYGDPERTGSTGKRATMS